MRALTLDEVKTLICGEARRCGLRPYGVDTLVSLESLAQTLRLTFVVEPWGSPLLHHAAVAVYYFPDEDAPARQHDGLFDDDDRLWDVGSMKLDVEVEYHLFSLAYPMGLAALEAHVKPRLTALSDALGDEPRDVEYTVSTKYEGQNFVVAAKVSDEYTVRVDEGELDLHWISEIARALQAIGPP